MDHAITLNALACSVLVLGGFVFCLYSHYQNKGNRRFVFRATVTWTAGLVPWLTLWWLYNFDVFHWGEEDTFRSGLAMRLSDVNTACGFLTYVILTRGQRERIWDHVRDALPLLTLPIVATVSIMAYDSWFHTKVHPGLSLAYSMITPVLVSWAIRLRFVVVLPLAVSCIYAILQPPAYGALFTQSAGQQAASSLAEGNPAGAALGPIVALMVLAIAKVIWGSLVFYALARDVEDCDSIVRSIPVSKKVERPQAIAFWVQISLGVIVLSGYLITLRQHARDVLDSTGKLVVIVTAIAGVVLAILAYHKSIEAASPKSIEAVDNKLPQPGRRNQKRKPAEKRDAAT